MKFFLFLGLCGRVLTAQPAEPSASEARAIIGLQQAGASAAKASQNFFFDFFIDRKLASFRWSLWGDVRVASTPQQISSPVSQFAFTQVGKLKINELAESAEFSTGLDFHPWSWAAGPSTRRFGFVLSFGASSPFNPMSRISLYEVPSQSSPQYHDFAAAFPTARDSAYVGFVPPDRRQFYRAWAAGIRLTTTGPQTPGASAPPATYTVTVGQDEGVTGGRLTGAVGKIDVFYALPVQVHAYRYIYLFGNASLRINRARNLTPLDLNPAPATVQGFEPTVAIVAVPSNRDVYRIGIGVDAVALITALTSKPQSAPVP